MNTSSTYHTNTHSLQTLASVRDINAHYLQHLDYIDMKKLCNTATSFTSLCNNENLKRILLQNPLIKLSPNINIIQFLDSFYQQFYKEVYRIFPQIQLPKWVIPDVFYDAMVRDALHKFVDRWTYQKLHFLHNDSTNFELSDPKFQFTNQSIISSTAIYVDECVDSSDSDECYVSESVKLDLVVFLEYVHDTMLYIDSKYKINTNGTYANRVKYKSIWVNVINDMLFLK